MSNHPNHGGGGEPNDPQWTRWQIAGVGVVQNLRPRGDEAATLGLGSFKCNHCQEPTFVVAVVHPDGREFSAIFPPEIISEFMMDASRRLADLGVNYIALEGLRSRSLVAELATMTDTEADFLDGGALREMCRSIFKGSPATAPRLYSAADRERAVDAIRDINAGRKSGTELRQMVDLVAGALGLTPAS